MHKVTFPLGVPFQESISGALLPIIDDYCRLLTVSVRVAIDTYAVLILLNARVFACFVSFDIFEHIRSYSVIFGHIRTRILALL